LLTTQGDTPDPVATCTIGLEDRPDGLVVWIERGSSTQRFRNDALAKPTTATILTVHGERPVSSLRRVLELCDGEQDVSVVVAWYAASGEQVRRDVWVIAKRPSVIGAALAASLA
jgi:hypothetical protein